MDIDERRKIARRIFYSAVESVQPDKLISGSVKMKNNLLRINNAVHHLRPDQNVQIFGSGKASLGKSL